MISSAPNNYLGEIAALTAAFLWAVSSLVYSRVGLKIPPLQLNLCKGMIAIALIGLTLAIQGQTFANISRQTLALLAFSGVIGIGLGDTAYFAALNSLGARRTLLLETASPPMGALLALILIGEQLTAMSWFGILLTVIGIAWVISERNPIDRIIISRQGIAWGLLAAIAQAVGSVISRFALTQSDISPLESTLIRLVGGTVVVGGLLIFSSRAESTSPKFRLSWRSLGIIAIAATGSTYLGIWLQQTSLKFAPTGIAQTLLATSPLFILPILAIAGEKINLRAILGVVISLGGIALMFIRG
ncbi:MAG: DMT family transporter [Cyanobacteria bacterium P01_G01_bin.19]